MSPLLGALLRWRRETAVAAEEAEEMSSTTESTGKSSIQVPA